MTTTKKLFTLTGPSCSGKTTLIRKLLETGHFSEVVSFTTRQPRHGEVHGTDYYFITPEQAQKLVDGKMTAEAIKFKENWYGITKYEIDDKFDSGKTPIVIVEPKGLIQLRKNYDCFVTYVDCDIVTLYTRFLSRFQKSPNANIDYEAKRVASLYLEHRNWLADVKESGPLGFHTEFREDPAQAEQVINMMVDFSKEYNNTK